MRQRRSKVAEVFLVMTTKYSGFTKNKHIVSEAQNLNNNIKTDEISINQCSRAEYWGHLCFRVNRMQYLTEIN